MDEQEEFYDIEDAGEALDYISEDVYPDMLELAAEILSNIRTKSGVKRSQASIIFDLAEACAFDSIRDRMTKDYRR